MTDIQQAKKGALHISGSEFAQTIKSAGTPVLVDFFAEWCGPCKLAAPVIDKLADEFAGKIVVAKVDVDQSNDLARQYQVMSIPTVLIFKQDGEKIIELDRKVGFPGEQGYRQMIEKALK